MAEATKGLGLSFLFIQLPQLNEQLLLSTKHIDCQNFLALSNEIFGGRVQDVPVFSP